MAVRFLRSWHGSLSLAGGVDGEGGEGLVSLVSLPSRKSLALGVNALVGAIERNGLDELIYPPWAAGADPGAGTGGAGGAGGTGWGAAAGVQNLYVSASLLKEAPPRGRRGGKDYVGRAPGVWMDLDVREGGFKDWDEVWAVVQMFDRLGVGPGLVVATGGGGAHLYWHVAGERDERAEIGAGAGLRPEKCESLGRGVRLWTQSQTGVAVDACENCDRVLRLPGSVHWPKSLDPGPEGGGGVATSCELIRCEVRWTPESELRELTAGAEAEWRERTRASRETYRSREGRAEEEVMGWLRRHGDEEESEAVVTGSWSYQYALIHAEEGYNNEVSWATILEPLGWTRNGGPDREGRQEWRRPGGGEHSGRSLVTDWVESPNAASLLSMAPETGLRGLHDAGVPLTKARVAAELWCGGDMSRLLTEWLARRG
jgi:hypothetical protein